MSLDGRELDLLLLTDMSMCGRKVWRFQMFAKGFLAVFSYCLLMSAWLSFIFAASRRCGRRRAFYGVAKPNERIDDSAQYKFQVPNTRFGLERCKLATEFCIMFAIEN